MAHLPKENPNAFKHLFGKALLERMSKALKKVAPHLDHQAFTALALKLDPLEMKPRVLVLRDELKRQLPTDYPKALRILLKTAKAPELGGFDFWPFSAYVQAYGLDHPTLSLEALKELTPRFSSEFAVRPFLKQDPTGTLAFLKTCARAPDVHLRRWASEGTRPRLPWGERLHAFIENPTLTLPILELLKFDEELYVRKSVSNHLNDIAKDHPELVVKLLKRWKQEAQRAKGTKGAEKKHADQVTWIIHRALRTLIKNGHPGALQLIGVSPGAEIKVSDLKLNQKQFNLGDRLEFKFTIQSTTSKPQKLVIDYIVHFVKANQKTSPKVFKLKTFVLSEKTNATVTKSHHLKKITTRVFYPGKHLLEIQINGAVLARAPWVLN